MADDTPKALNALRVDEQKLKGHADEVVRSSVEETLNALLDAEAVRICRAQRYERSPDRGELCLIDGFKQCDGTLQQFASARGG